jgi:hypothetical protein
VGAAAEKLASLGHAMQALFDPAGLTPAAGQASRIIRQHRAEMDRDVARAHEALDHFRKAFRKLPPDLRWAWVDRIETGDIAAISDPHLRAAAQLVRKLMDADRDAVQALGTGKLEHFYEDYFPHIWKDAAQAKNVVGQMLGKRPMEGSKGFLKQRTIMTVADGLAAGLTPASDNPLDLVLLKHREMRRYLMAHRIFQEGRAEGLIRFKKASRPVPQGYAKINDAIATVFAPRGAEGETRIRGEYVAPVEVARVLNNFLSPGLRGNAIYDAYATAGNTLNMVQLGLSAFHMGFVTFDATVQTAVTGLQQLLSGKGRGGRPAGAARLLLGAASAATAPLTILPLPAAIVSYLDGRKLWKAYMSETPPPALVPIVEGLVAGGGRAKMDDYYRSNNVQTFIQALRDRRWVTAGLNLPLAVVAGTMHPLMEHVIPRMKMGAIYAALEVERGKLGPNATPDEVRRVAAKVVDAVDARLGQMIYDNRFWHRATKEVLMAGIRSVGWNVGTLDVTVGAGAQAAGNLLGAARGTGGQGSGKGRDWHKVQYLATLAGLVALYGAIKTYLNTGEAPDDWRDFYFPRTGKKDRDGNAERSAPPTYMKDVFALGRHPVQTLGHKLHPMLSAAADVLQNRTFYGDEVVNRDDPALTQAKQVAGYVLKDLLVPFSVRNAQELTSRGEGVKEKAEGFLGLQAAPREVVRTPAQNKMNEFLGRRGQPTRTPEQAADREARSAIAEGVRGGAVGRDSVRRLVRAGEIAPGSAANMLVGAKLGGLVMRFRMLTPEEARIVYNLGTPQERALWARWMKAKERRARRIGSLGAVTGAP